MRIFAYKNSVQRIGNFKEKFEEILRKIEKMGQIHYFLNFVKKTSKNRGSMLKPIKIIEKIRKYKIK